MPRMRISILNILRRKNITTIEPDQKRDPYYSSIKCLKLINNGCTK